MKKISSLAFYAMVAPVITLGSGALLAQAASDTDAETKQQGTQYEQGAAQLPAAASPRAQTQAGQNEALPVAAQQNERARANMPSHGYLNAVPANAIAASYLIGAPVSTTGAEDVGPVDDLIIGEDGQVLAIIVGVGGFLGIGEKVVAIGWADVTSTGDGDELELQIDVSREDLTSAPDFTMGE